MPAISNVDLFALKKKKKSIADVSLSTLFWF